MVKFKGTLCIPFPEGLTDEEKWECYRNIVDTLGLEDYNREKQRFMHDIKSWGTMSITTEEDEECCLANHVDITYEDFMDTYMIQILDLKDIYG